MTQFETLSPVIILCIGNRYLWFSPLNSPFAISAGQIFHWTENSAVVSAFGSWLKIKTLWMYCLLPLLPLLLPISGKETDSYSHPNPWIWPVLINSKIVQHIFNLWIWEREMGVTTWVKDIKHTKYHMQILELLSVRLFVRLFVRA
jgi:hypothetical protein